MRVRSKKVLAKRQQEQDDRVDALRKIAETTSSYVKTVKKPYSPSYSREYLYKGLPRREIIAMLLRYNNPLFVMMRYGSRTKTGMPDGLSLVCNDGVITPAYLTDMSAWAEQVVQLELDVTTWCIMEVREIQVIHKQTSADGVVRLVTEGVMPRSKYVHNRELAQIVQKRDKQGRLVK